MKLKELLEEMYMEYSWPQRLDYDETHDTFSFEYESGGAEGGNCWGDSASYYTKSVPDFTVLQDLALKAYPDIALRTYLALYGSMSIEERTQYEYYGNHTEYRVYVLDMEKMKSILEDAGHE